jgi:ATP-dependent DNA helicase RecG
MQFGDPIDTIKGVGPAVADKFRLLNIKTVDDLIEYYPRRYDDYSEVSLTAKIKPGNTVTVRVVLKQATGRYVRRGMHITEAVASDESGSIRLIWFNQPYRAAAIKPGEKYFVSGNFELSRGRLAIMNPSMELESNFPISTARIVPVYRETKGHKSSAIRKIIAGLRLQISEVQETLPLSVVQSANLLPKAEALLAIHFPESQSQLSEAKRRLGFEELFSITLASLLNKQQFAKESGVHIPFDQELAKTFVQSLPFKLTNAQRKVIWQIYKDLDAKQPANRLVEGDVGSGKTVVAAMASVMAIKQGFQVTLMAPTELLASQHADSLHRMLSYVDMDKCVALLVGSMTSVQKRRVHEQVKDGAVKLIVGTHALISDNVDLHNLGLVIVDEQHRFGVEQRKKLQKKATRMPHVISMTATPIPRTLALTLYGELEISVLDEMPPGRTPIITSIVSPNSKSPMYEQIESQLSSGKQVFVVCPLIQESEKLQALSAEKVYDDLSKKIFKNWRVGLLHGKLKPEEKDAMMARFVRKEVDILVSTTVIEVGVDVPNATVMVIEGAERFGLAQIHQLRGRVGRGSDQGYCYLVLTDSKQPPQRLRALENTTDGFKLAELDLKLRGPGAIYGQAQSGQLDLRIANLTDVRLIAQARQGAQQFLESSENLKKYPVLNAQVSKYRTVTNLN